MKNRDYIRILMAPLSMLTVFACAPDQFQSSQEYDDVYFTSADRVSKPTIIESTQEIESSNQKAFSLSDYSSEAIDPMLVNRYSNSQNGEVVYFEEGPRVTKASELNYDDFVYDYENENLLYYELPLDWNRDWDESSFNSLMVNDFQFKLAWYEQYYLNRDFRMNNYLSGRSGIRMNGLTTPRVGLNINFVSSGFTPFLFSSMTYVNLNHFGSFDPFWQPYFDPFWGYGSYYSSFGRPWRWNRWNRNPYNNYYYTSNNFYNDGGNFVNRDGRDITRGGRISSTSVSSVRTDAVNGSTPNTRSARYTSDLGARGSRSAGADGFQVVSGRNSSTATSASNARSSRVNTNAYQFSNDSRLTRSNVVRSSSSRNSRSNSASPSVTSVRSSSSSSNLFSRSSSTRSSTPTYSRSSSNSRSSGVSSSRSSRSSGVSSSRSSGNSSSSSSRSSGSVSSSSSRGGSSSSSSSGRSGNSSSSSSSSRSGSSSSSSSGRGN